MTNLKTHILKTVQENKITMIPKWKFVLYSSLGVFGLMFTFFIAVFILSLVLFVLSNYGLMYMPFFGVMATLHTLRDVPHTLLLLTLILLVISEVLSRKYSFSFRKPLSMTLLSLTFFAAVASFFVSQSKIHDYVHAYAIDHKFNALAQIYDRPRSFKDMDGMTILRGEITTVSTSSMTLKLFDGVLLTTQASTSLATEHYSPLAGDDVVVFGSFVGNVFRMIDVRPAPKFPFGRPFKEHRHDGKFERGPHEINS